MGMTLLVSHAGYGRCVAGFDSGSRKAMSHNRQLHILSYHRFHGREWL